MDKGISMNGQPIGGMSMNGESFPVAHGTPYVASPPPAYHPAQGPVALGLPYVAPPPPAYHPAQNAYATQTAYPLQEQQKIGSKCCGCCCDFRRAVTILDCIVIAYCTLILVSLAFPSDIREKQFEMMEINDDQVQDELLEMTMVTNIIFGCGVVALAVPAYGAQTFHAGMVGFGIVWFVLSFVAQVVVEVVYTGKANDVAQEDVTVLMPFTSWIFYGFVTALFIYPHVGLFNEIRSGVMSEATYPREEFSCCCGKN
jgi:uncharacterized membrane protein (DUF485 family)